MACAQLGPAANFKPAISASQLLPVSYSTSGPARATWISRNALSVCKSGRLMYRGAVCNRKRACSFIFNVRRWIELRLQHCRKLSTISRHKPGLKIRSEAPSPHIPDTSSKTNGETVNAITGNLGSASTLTTLEVPNVVDANSSTSITGEIVLSQSDNTKLASNPFLSIVVLGATGELAKSKIFPALFALYYSCSLPKNFAIFGYSRSKQTDTELRESISERLTCRIDDQGNCGEKTKIFLERVFYQSGGYESCDNLRTLDGRLVQLEGVGVANRIFYLSIPQDVLLVVASCLSASAQSQKGWTRLIVEKPFGNDAASSAQITKALLSGFEEDQIYRIDHLLGKEIIENLTVLRFSNLVFEPLWSLHLHQECTEDWGVTEGKGRYFDEQGVIRDLVQSHLLQTIALFAMEPPVSLDGNDIRNEKVKVLRSMRKPTFPHDVVLGQYKASISKDGKSRIRGYLDEPDVNPNSITPTFVATILYIDNARWDGVPFLVKAGKGLIKHTLENLMKSIKTDRQKRYIIVMEADEVQVEIRIQFRHVPGNLYGELFGYNVESSMNELILRVQPDAGIFLKINNKVPGLGTQLDTTELNLLYREKYDDEIPDSYERLILDVIDGDNHLFIRGDELEATWDLFSPLLEEIQTLKVAPELYTFGGRGPIGSYYLGANHGVKWADD